jgi:hypothetical protein
MTDVPERKAGILGVHVIDNPVGIFDQVIAFVNHPVVSGESFRSAPVATVSHAILGFGLSMSYPVL